MTKKKAVKKRGRPSQFELPFMDTFDSLTEEGQNYVAAILTLESREAWHGQAAVPPGSILEDVLRTFERHTDIPLELPFLGWMTYLSGFLCAQDMKIKINESQEITPKIWNVALAPSGAGKTFAVNRVRKQMTAVPEMENAGSGVALIQAIQRTPKGVWFRDEFGQLLKSMQTQPHMEKAKDVLLNAYSGDAIEHITKKESIRVEEHAFSILGITVGDTFLEQVGAESLIDGFAQRFNYLYAERDPNRPITDYPIYFDDRKMTREDTRRAKRIEKGMAELMARDDLRGTVLTLSDDAMDIFTEVFQDNFKNALPESFYRRSMFTMFAYAAIYHIVLDKRGTEIGNQAMAYAARLVMMHLKDTKKLLEKSGWSELHLLIEKCAEWKAGFESKHGKKPTARDLIAGVRQIKTVAIANTVLRMI